MSKYIIIGGSEECRAEAIAKLRAEGHEIITREEAMEIMDLKLSESSFDPHLLQAFIIKAPTHDQFLDTEIISRRSGKKVKGKKNKFKRQPWE